MAMNQRVERNLQKIAHLIGGIDENGVEHFKNLKDDQLEAKQRQHLFWIKNRDNEHAVGTFVLGHLIESKLVEDLYDFEYMGLHENWQTNKKVLKKSLEQVDDIVAGKKARDRRNGLFRDDTHYDALAEQMKNEAKGTFPNLK